MPIPLLNPAILARLEALAGGLRATNVLKIQKPRNNVYDSISFEFLEVRSQAYLP
jgi:hypothetical protein